MRALRLLAVACWAAGLVGGTAFCRRQPVSERELLLFEEELGPAAPPLDGEGRRMLAPARARELRPAELVARLGLEAAASSTRPGPGPDPSPAAGSQPGATASEVVEVGSGPGYFTLPLLRAIGRGRLLATDPRPDYLAVVRHRARRAGLAPLETRVMAADRPALPRGRYRLIVVNGVDRPLVDPEAAVARLAAALSSTGRLALILPAADGERVQVAAAKAALRALKTWRPSPRYLLVVLSR